MPAERLPQIVRSVLPAGDSPCQFQILPQHRAIIRMGAVFDDELCPLLRCLPPEIRHALFGDDNLYVMFGMIHM